MFDDKDEEKSHAQDNSSSSLNKSLLIQVADGLGSPQLKGFDPKHSSLFIKYLNAKGALRLKFDYNTHPPFKCHIFKTKRPKEYTLKNIFSKIPLNVTELYIRCKLAHDSAKPDILKPTLLYFNRYDFESHEPSEETIRLSKIQAEGFDKEVVRYGKFDDPFPLNSNALKYLSNNKLHDRGKGLFWLHKKETWEKADWESISPENRESWLVEKEKADLLIQRFKEEYKQQKDSRSSRHTYSRMFGNCHLRIAHHLQDIVDITTVSYREKFHTGISKYWLFLKLHSTITLASCFPAVYATFEEYALSRAFFNEDHRPGVVSLSIKDAGPLIIPTIGIFVTTSGLTLAGSFISNYWNHESVR